MSCFESGPKLPSVHFLLPFTLLKNTVRKESQNHANDQKTDHQCPSRRAFYRIDVGKQTHSCTLAPRRQYHARLHGTHYSHWDSLWNQMGNLLLVCLYCDTDIAVWFLSAADPDRFRFYFGNTVRLSFGIRRLRPGRPHL